MQISIQSITKREHGRLAREGSSNPLQLLWGSYTLTKNLSTCANFNPIDYKELIKTSTCSRVERKLDSMCLIPRNCHPTVRHKNILFFTTRSYTDNQLQKTYSKSQRSQEVLTSCHLTLFFLDKIKPHDNLSPGKINQMTFSLPNFPNPFWCFRFSSVSSVDCA